MRLTAVRERPRALGRRVCAASCLRLRSAPRGDRGDFSAVRGGRAQARGALATRHSLVRRVRPRAVLAARVLCRAAQRLRPPTASTPVLVALAHGMPPRGPSAVRMWHASAGLSAMTVALGGNKGNPIGHVRAYGRDCAQCATGHAPPGVVVRARAVTLRGVAERAWPLSMTTPMLAYVAAA